MARLQAPRIIRYLKASEKFVRAWAFLGLQLLGLLDLVDDLLLSLVTDTRRRLLDTGDGLATVHRVNKQSGEGVVVACHQLLHEIVLFILADIGLFAAHQVDNPSRAVTVTVYLDGLLELAGVILFLLLEVIARPVVIQVQFLLLMVKEECQELVGPAA